MRRAKAAFAALVLAFSFPGLAYAQDAAVERLGEIHWYGVPARCTFQTPTAAAAFHADDPETWRFVFLTMSERGVNAPVERGYILMHGVLRELEKVRSGLDNTRRTATVWRSAGEPRINVNVTLSEATGGGADKAASGRLSVISGDGRREVDIVGHCRD